MVKNTSIVYFSAGRVDGFEQLVNLVIAHFLAEVGQNITQLTDAYETRHVFIKHPEPLAVFFRLARIAETARSIENFRERVEINYSIRYFR